MPRPKKVSLESNMDTILLSPDSAIVGKRKVISPYTPTYELDSAAKEVIDKLDRQDESYSPKDDQPASKKPKSSRKQGDPSEAYSLDINSPPEKGKSQSRKNWATIHCNRTLKQLPNPSSTSTSELFDAYERSKALNIFLKGEFEYQSDVASKLRKKGARDLQIARMKIEELEVAVGNVDSTRCPSKNQNDSIPASSTAEADQITPFEQNRYLTISTNFAKEIGNLKMQLEMSKHDKLIAEKSGLNAQRQLQITHTQMTQLKETTGQSLAALRTEVSKCRHERDQAAKQLNEALSSWSKAESEILGLKNEKDDTIKAIKLEYTNKHHKFEKDFKELEDKLAKQQQELKGKDRQIREQQQAFTTAMAFLNRP